MMGMIYFCGVILIFLWGMGLVRKGLMRVTWCGIEKCVVVFTDHGVKGLLVSIVFRGVVERSWGFMVMVMGFVSRGIVRF
ncbi:Na/Pi symporter, partial [Bacillus altitudinis]|uniref:Na/Pi symporter n=1 Tax=Bacillus altitudinis TaxID=293387 RepID=UPI0016438F74